MSIEAIEARIVAAGRTVVRDVDDIGLLVGIPFGDGSKAVWGLVPIDPASHDRFADHLLSEVARAERVSSLDAEAFTMLEHSKLQMGMNYLIADGVVYGVMVWALGGIADRQIWRPREDDYEFRYKTATKDPHTLFVAKRA